MSSLTLLTKEEQNTAKKYLQLLLYLQDFEQLRITQSLSEFEKCNKKALAKSLWISHRNSVEGLRLICKLCIDYSILDGLVQNVLEALQNMKDVIRCNKV
jgi:Rough deal protein C-terminal region